MYVIVAYDNPDVLALLQKPSQNTMTNKLRVCFLVSSLFFGNYLCAFICPLEI